MSENTHGSTVCTSCDYIPYTDCEKYKDGTYPLCCPNLEESVKEAIRKQRRTETQ